MLNHYLLVVIWDRVLPRNPSWSWIQPSFYLSFLLPWLVSAMGLTVELALIANYYIFSLSALGVSAPLGTWEDPAGTILCHSRCPQLTSYFVLQKNPSNFLGKLWAIKYALFCCSLVNREWLWTKKNKEALTHESEKVYKREDGKLTWPYTTKLTS